MRRLVTLINLKKIITRYLLRSCRIICYVKYSSILDRNEPLLCCFPFGLSALLHIEGRAPCYNPRVRECLQSVFQGTRNPAFKNKVIKWYTVKIPKCSVRIKLCSQ